MGFSSFNGNWIGRNSGVSWSSYWATHLYGEDYLNFRARSRSGLSLVDDYGNNASILLPFLSTKVISYGDKDPSALSAIPIMQNTIWVAKIRDFTGDGIGCLCSGNGGFKILKGYYGGSKFKFTFGSDKNIQSETLVWNTDTKVYIVYDNKFWFCDKNTEFTDAAILNIINNVTPSFTTSGTLEDATDTLFYFRHPTVSGSPTAYWYKSFIGTVTDGVISWQAKHIFNNPYYVYDILGNEHISILTNLNRPAVLYDADADRTCLNEGHTKCLRSGAKPISLPYINGIPDLDAPLFTGYVRSTDNPAIVTKHNLADSIIEFSGDEFDRSNTDIYEDLARAATTYYDVANPKRWHVSELNRLQLNEWIKEDYRGRWFPKILPNSVDEEETLSIDEIFAYSTNMNADDFNKILAFCGDYELVII